MMRRIGAAAIFLLVALVQPAMAEECSQMEAYAAEVVADYLDSWSNAYRFFKEFGHCLDGSIAEVAEDRIQLLWSDSWSALPKMIELAKSDTGFAAYLQAVLRSEAFPQDRFAVVLGHARRRCVPVATDFCRAVIAQSRAGGVP
jgi:hypothetical protein